MNYKDFTEDFLKEFKRRNEKIIVKKYWNKEKTLLLNYPYKKINTEIKPLSTGIFVIQLLQFEFFDYPLLENYWRKKLKHKNANFILTSKCIYIYPREQENILQCISILNYTTEIILDTFVQINILLCKQD